MILRSCTSPEVKHLILFNEKNSSRSAEVGKMPSIGEYGMMERRCCRAVELEQGQVEPTSCHRSAIKNFGFLRTGALAASKCQMGTFIKQRAAN